MRTSRPQRGGSPGQAVGVGSPVLTALPALLCASHLLGLAFGSALGKLRDSGVTAAKMFERAEEQASALEISQFVSRTARRHGWPAHFVSDRARCFTGQIFRLRLLRLCVKQRFGAVGKKGSIALIERLWRTLKDALGLRLLRPLVAEDLAAKIEVGLVHYAHFRPHQGVGGATPGVGYAVYRARHLGKPGSVPGSRCNSGKHARSAYLVPRSGIAWRGSDRVTAKQGRRRRRADARPARRPGGRPPRV